MTPTPAKLTQLKRQVSPGSRELESVPVCFESGREYLRIWKPLALQECRASVTQTIEKLTASVASDGGQPNVRPLKFRVISTVPLSTTSMPSYVKVHLKFLDVTINAGNRIINTSRGSGRSGGIQHTFAHYQHINKDSRRNPLQKSIVLILSSKPR
jgi:hypothetical protein